MKDLAQRALDRGRRLMRWAGMHESAVLIAMTAVAVGTWGFVEVTGEVLEGDTQTFDENIIRALRQPDDPRVPIGPRWMEEVGRDFTALGGYSVLIFVFAAVLGYLALDRKFGAMLFVGAAIVGGFLLTFGLKAVFRRPRPEIVPHLSIVMTSSFPSGHSMMSAVVYLTLGTLLGRFVPSFALKFYFLALAVILTTLVGASRVYMGVHYPTDVLAGWSAGMAWATLCWLVARRLQRRGKLEKEDEQTGDLVARP